MIMSKKRRHKNHELAGSFPLSKLFPNVVTIIGLCFGLFALKYAMTEHWETAVIFILIAALLDGMDGRIARFLNATSRFGAQLDSLADFFNFSVAPALILYMWSMKHIKGIGWAVALLFIICGALRLARFNAAIGEEKRDKPAGDKFFVGVPAPMAAGLSLVPMTLAFLFKEHYVEPPFIITPLMVLANTVLVAFLMISELPTISIKKITIRREFTSFAMAAFALLIVALIAEPWITLTSVGAIYVIITPIGVVWHYRLNKQASQVK